MVNPHKPQARWKILPLFAVCLVLLPVLSSASSVLENGAHSQTPEWNIHDMSLSPDGEQLAFTYALRNTPSDAVYTPHVGLYTWRTEKLTLIANPGGTIKQPSFSDNGKRLVVVTCCDDAGQHLATIDVASLKRTPVPEKPWTRNIAIGEGKPDYVQVRDGAKEYPIFQPGTNAILYIAGNDWKVPVLLNPKDGSKRPLLDEKTQGFVYFLQPSFTTTNDIYFQAISPNDPALVSILEPLGITHTNTAYHLALGGKPEFLFPSWNQKFLSINEVNGFHASTNARTMIGVSPSNPPHSSSRYTYELFRIEKDGSRTQLTHLNGSNISQAALSAQGNVAAFMNNDTLHLIDPASAKEMHTANLIEKIIADPQFPASLNTSAE